MLLTWRGSNVGARVPDRLVCSLIFHEIYPASFFSAGGSDYQNRNYRGSCYGSILIIGNPVTTAINLRKKAPG
jgi:hypothetical protein